MNQQQNNQSEIVLYTTPDGTFKIDTVFQNETIWLTQAKMAELFNINRSVITKHLSNIYNDEELKKNATCAKFAHVQMEDEASTVCRQLNNSDTLYEECI